MDGFWGIQGCILFHVTLQKHFERVQLIETTIKTSSIGRPFNLGWFYFEKMATQEQTLYHKNCNRLSRFFWKLFLFLWFPPAVQNHTLRCGEISSFGRIQDSVDCNCFFCNLSCILILTVATWMEILKYDPVHCNCNFGNCIFWSRKPAWKELIRF